MIKTITIPQGTASSTTQSMVVEIIENLCKNYCVNSNNTLSGLVNFSTGTVSVLNDTAIVPITATGAIVVKTGKCVCNAKTYHFSETFNIAFEATTDNDVTLTAGTNNTVSFYDVFCCHTSEAILTTTLTATIA